MHNFSERQKRIINMIANSRGVVSGRKISAELHCSLRSVQSDVREINTALPLIQSSYQGYTLSKTEFDKIKGGIIEEDETIKYTLLRNLILANEKLPVDEFAESLFISTTGLEKQLKNIRPLLAAYELQLNRAHHRVWITGKEQNKRKLINFLIFKEINPSFHSFETISVYFQGIDVNRIKAIILNAIHKYNYYVEDNYSYNLFTNIIIALYRIRTDSHMETVCEYEIQKKQAEYQIANEICDQYALHWKISPKHSDIVYIAVLLTGQIKPLCSTVCGNNHPDILQETFVKKIDNILSEVFTYYMLNINYDEFLYNFSLHIDAMIKRSSNHQTVNNDILENIKTNCPFIYEVAIYISRRLTDTFHITVSEEEIGYISIHIGFLIENAEEDIAKVKILLICSSYHHISENIKEKLNKKYKHNIEVCDKKEMLENLSDYDLIIATSPISLIGSRVLEVSPFYSAADQREVENTVNILLKEKEEEYHNKLISLYFDKNLFFSTDAFPDKFDAIRFLAQKIIDRGFANDGFIESVISREHMSSTCFFDTFAIPHAIDLNAKKTMFCVLISRQGIQWDNSKIHIVLMIAVHQQDRKKFMKIYNGVIRSLWNKEKVQALINTDNLNEFLGILQSI